VNGFIVVVRRRKSKEKKEKGEKQLGLVHKVAERGRRLSLHAIYGKTVRC